MAAKRTPASGASRFNLPIFLVALFGVLVVIHLSIQLDRGFTHGCLGFSAPTGEIAECAGVIGSEFGKTFGISNVLLGLVFFLGIAGLRFGVAATRPPLSRSLERTSFAAVGAGLLFALYLASVQVFQLDQYCVLCLISGGTTALLFGLHVVEWKKGDGGAPVDAAVAAPPGLRFYGVGLAALFFLAAADYALLSDTVDDAPAFAQTERADGMTPTSAELADACQYDPQLTNFTLFDMFTGDRAAFEGNPSAPGKALKVFDPNCPHCGTLHRALEEVVPAHNDGVRFYYQPIALWDHSIAQVQAMYIAREHSNEAFVQMMDLQFKRQRPGGIPVDTLAAFAAEIGLDAEEFRAEIVRGKYAQRIRSERQMTAGAGVNSVPKLFFNGDAMAALSVNFTNECLNYFAERAAEG